jgi:transcriptional regulator with GAF, ATPase, and Fis domain
MKRKTTKPPIGSLQAATNALHQKMVVDALQKTETFGQAAKLLGCSLSSLKTLIKRFGIERTVKVTKTVTVKIKKS